MRILAHDLGVMFPLCLIVGLAFLTVGLAVVMGAAVRAGMVIPPTDLQDQLPEKAEEEMRRQ